MSIFVLAGGRFSVLHTTYELRVSYHTVVVLCQFFWFWREIVFGVMYVLSVQYSCAVVSVFLYYDWKKKSSSRLSGGCAKLI